MITSPQKPAPETPLQMALRDAGRHLQGAGIENAGLEAEVLLADCLQQKRDYLYRSPEICLSPGILARYQKQIWRRSRHEPLAYILGYKEFFSRSFKVDPAVLIPRPETELLVEMALAELVSKDRPTICEVGTGSGIVAISLALALNSAEVCATDLSPAALQIARHNCRLHGVENRILLQPADLLPEGDKIYDLILSNPPYISQAEFEQLPPEIKKFEPCLSLEGGADGLDCIQRLIQVAPSRLKDDGQLLFEIGAGQGPASTKLAAVHFSKVSLHKDLAGRDRLVLCQEKK